MEPLDAFFADEAAKMLCGADTWNETTDHQLMLPQQDELLTLLDHTEEVEGFTSTVIPGAGATIVTTAPPGGDPTGSEYLPAPGLVAAPVAAAVSTTTTAQTTTTNQQQQQQSQLGWYHPVWQPAFPSATATATAGTTASRESSKTAVSHSTVEKQRRDRINTLIDELRDLVPPSEASFAQGGTTAKGAGAGGCLTDSSSKQRPKHAVLSDTIALLRHLKQKVQQDEMERQWFQLWQQQQQQQQMVLTANSASAETLGAAVATATAATDGDASARVTSNTPLQQLQAMMMPPQHSAADRGGSAVVAGSGVGVVAAAAVPSALPAAAAAQQSTSLQRSLSNAAADGGGVGVMRMMPSADTSSPAAATAATATAAAPARGGGRSSSSPGCLELPQAPPNLPSSVGVLVEEGADSCSFKVNVNCRDRPGLLNDITSALRNLPVQITRAAITTNKAGTVLDVFEVVADPLPSPPPPSSAVAAAATAKVGDKQPGIGGGDNNDDASGGEEGEVRCVVTALDVQYHIHQAVLLHNKWRNRNSSSLPGGGAAASTTAVKRCRT